MLSKQVLDALRKEYDTITEEIDAHRKAIAPLTERAMVLRKTINEYNKLPVKA